jgi:hypothetical protein
MESRRKLIGRMRVVGKKRLSGVWLACITPGEVSICVPSAASALLRCVAVIRNADPSWWGCR